MIEGLAGHERQAAARLGAVVQQLAPRWFVMRDAHTEGDPVLLQPRWTLSWLRGPMTRAELLLARSPAPLETGHAQPSAA